MADSEVLEGIIDPASIESPVSVYEPPVCVPVKRRGRPKGTGMGYSDAVHFKLPPSVVERVIRRAGTGNISEAMRQAVSFYLR